ncbi:MAG: protein O-mannosyl-transferase family, partial [Phycisphaerae bacterium]
MSEPTPAIDPAAAAVATPAGRLFRAGACMFLATLILYAATTQHGPAWQDSGIFQWRVLHSDFRGELGIALAHPLLIAVGSLFRHLPVGDVAYRINLVSAVFGAIAAASLLMLLLRLFPGRWLLSLVTAGWFALAHTPWWLATICESQIILVAIFTLELHAVVSLVRRPSWSSAATLGLLNGLGLATHNLALLALPAYGLLVLWVAYRRRLPVAGVGLFIAAWCVGASPWIGLVLAEASRSGLSDAVRSGLFGRSWQQSVLLGSGRALKLGPAYVVLNF